MKAGRVLHLRISVAVRVANYLRGRDRALPVSAIATAINASPSAVGRALKRGPFVRCVGRDDYGALTKWAHSPP